MQGLWQINRDWNLLIQQSYQNMDADGASAQYPIGSDCQALGAWQITSFVPRGIKTTGRTLPGRSTASSADFKAVYTGGYLSRTINSSMDYTNYSRSVGGIYYECAGGPAGSGTIGAGHPPAPASRRCCPGTTTSATPT